MPSSLFVGARAFCFFGESKIRLPQIEKKAEQSEIIF